MQPSGVDAAIRELEQDVRRVQEAIAVLKKIQSQRTNNGASSGRGRRRLSAQARRRISEAAKKRWAALRAAAKR
ncbi:MAG: hypothetical protein HY648_01705 [Acidobacteria bacterium]|nr:hypothetical protein [Acidobacteriota bacterium]